MKFFFAVVGFLCVFAALEQCDASKPHSKPIKIAIIDTGLDPKFKKLAHLCPTGHRDLTGEGLDDYHGHGTNVTGLIVDNAGNSNYCIIIIKAYAFRSPVMKPYIPEALAYAYSIKPDVINVSGGGSDPILAEKVIVNQILNSKIKLIVAAGNKGTDLNVNCNYFPACYDPRIIVVGTNDRFSNKGSVVDIKTLGNKLTGFGVTMSGTSQATAVVSGNVTKQLANSRKVR